MASDTGEHSAGARRRHRYSTERMLALSDGVFAFAITLLVLDLVVPNLTGNMVMHELWEGWPQYLGYIVSFATIGMVWLNHCAITEHLKRTDSIAIRINLLILILVSFLPFPTRFLSRYINSGYPEQIAVTLYGITVLMIFGLMIVLWSYARREGHLDLDDTDPTSLSFLSSMKRISLAYMGMIVLGLAAPLLAVFGYFIAAVIFIVPFRLRKIRRWF